MIWQIFLLEALKLVLKNNHFIFNKEFLSNCWNRYRYYLEVRWYLEIKFYEKCKNEFGVNKGKYIEENRHRFLDDYYIALDATNINSTKLLYILNNIYDNIKFIIKQHNLYLPFLYTIWMDTYKILILGDVFLFTFDHHKQCKIPFTLAIRICTIVENRDVRKKR